jgi:hypothetical protein
MSMSPARAIDPERPDGDAAICAWSVPPDSGTTVACAAADPHRSRHDRHGMIDMSHIAITD